MTNLKDNWFMTKSAFVFASNFVNDERRLVNVTLPETNASFNDLH